MTNLLPSVEREYKDKIRQIQIEKEQVGSVILMEVTRLINTAEHLSEEQKTKLLIALWKGRAKKEITEDCTVKHIILSSMLVLITACVNNTPKQEIIYYDYIANKDKLEKMERCEQEASLILVANESLLSQEQSVRLYKLLLDSCAIHYGIAI